MPDIPIISTNPYAILIQWVVGNFFKTRRRAPPIEEQLRVFNANNPAPTAPGGAIEDRRAAAQRAIDAVNKAIGEIPQAPWLRRKAFGRHGKLYTLQDARRNILTRNKAINDAKAKAAREEIRRQNTARTSERAIFKRPDFDPKSRSGLPTSVPSAYRPRVFGNPFFEPIIGEIATRVFERSQRSEARHKQLLRVRRRGALATRPLSNSSAPRIGRTNRTGAASTRRTTTGLPTATKPGTQSQQPTAGSVGSGTRQATGESSTSRQAREKMGGSRSQLPTRTATSGATSSRTVLNSLLRIPLQAGMSRLLSSGGGSRARAGARTPTRALTPTGTLPSFGLRLTPLNSVGVGSQTQQEKCNCPKPKKQKDKKQFPCSNPLISRSVTKDGVITIKRKLQCPPSKPKSP